MSARATAFPPISKSLREYARGLTGGLMFSLPLLYTMEIWQAGFNTPPERLMVCILVTFALLLGYNRYAGMRQDSTWLEVAIDSIEEMGLGLLLAAFMLLLLGQIKADMETAEIVGKVVLEAMTVAIGISVGTSQLGGGDAEDTEDKGLGEGSGKEKPDFTGQLVIGFCGAVLFAANIAPTDEIMTIAHSIVSWRLLALVVLSLLLCALILFFSEFSGSKRFVTGFAGRHMLGGTAVTYASALLASAMLLWFFGRFDGEPLVMCIGQTIVLGVAGALGASAGRLLLQ